jgi:hypothetical protein
MLLFYNLDWDQEGIFNYFEFSVTNSVGKECVIMNEDLRSVFTARVSILFLIYEQNCANFILYK